MVVNRKAVMIRRGAGGETPARGTLADNVLFIDAQAIVIDKPAGLPVDAPRDGALSVQNHLDALRFGFARWPMTVHRLDRDTSGCLLLARNPKAARRFAAAFEAGTVEKTYLAVLNGLPEAAQGCIELPLGKTSSQAAGWRMVPDAGGKRAVTRWRTLATRGGKTLVELRPETGRTHQLRAHALHGLGVGIVGDPIYRANGSPRPMPGTPMLLHAYTLGLPRGDKPALRAMAPVPASFAQAGFADAADLAGPQHGADQPA